MSEIDRPSVDAVCPRCGYDLRGVVALWTDSCPLEGTCSECGLAFAWREILADRERPPAWCVETGPLRRSIPATIWRLQRPRQFWHGVTLRHATNWKRLIALNLAILFIAYLMFCAFSAGGMWVYLCTTSRATGAVVNTDEISVLGWALLAPWNNEPAGTMTYTGGGMTLDSPLSRLVGWWKYSQSAVILITTVVAMFAMPLVFVLLPMARIRAKVRWQHFARIALYTPAILVAPLGVLMASDIVQQLTPYTQGQTVLEGWVVAGAHWLVRVGPLALALLLWWWWYCACRHYLRMEHARLVAFSVVLVSLLVGVVMCFALDPDWVQRFFHTLFREWQ